MTPVLSASVLAPNAKLRGEIIPSPPEQETEPSKDAARGTPARMSWARLLKRVFDFDIERCANCGGDLKIIAAIEDLPVIDRILSHLGLPTRADGAARSEFERAARKGTFRAPATGSPPEPTQAKAQISLIAPTIDTLACSAI